MTYLFGRRGLAEIAALLEKGPLLAFDFDGTLAALTPYPDRARLAARTRRLLARVAARHPVVVISGRKRADVERRLDGIPIAGVTGNHGLEPWGETPATERLVRRWRQSLEADLGHLPGVRIQDKHWSLTVDYRWASDRAAAEARVKDAIRKLPRVRLVGGRDADCGLAPAVRIHKGTALGKHLKALKRRAALYVGDDRTDEDVFALERPDLLSVRVGRSRNSRARFYLRDQVEVDSLLERLL